MACSQADCGSHQSPPHHAIISLYTYVTFADVLDFWPQKNQVVMHSVFETIITIVDQSKLLLFASLRAPHTSDDYRVYQVEQMYAEHVGGRLMLHILNEFIH